MAKMMLSLHAPVLGLGKLQLVGRGNRGARGCGTAVRASASPQNPSSGCQGSLVSVQSLFPSHDGNRKVLGGPQMWMEKVSSAELSKAATPMMASMAFYLQASSPAFAVGEPGDLDVKFIATVVASLVIAFLYFLVIPLITYNYLRLRWYKRNAAETYFQFMLVFLFFPGMLLLAPFINFRRLPKKGTQPP